MVNDVDKPINILGAGISGLSAAIVLSRNRLNVKVLEKSSHSGGRFNRDFQCLQNFGNIIFDPVDEFEKIGIKIKPYKQLTRVIRHSRSYSFEVIHNKKPIYYLVLRGYNENSLDNQLEKLAVNQGVNICFNTKVNLDEVDIIATGPSRADGIAYGEIYYDTNIDETGHVFFDDKLSPDGYLYVLPGVKKGEAEIINCTRGLEVNKRTIKLLYTRGLHKNNILKDLLDGATRKSVQGGIGCFTLLDKFYQNNKYFVGEAAGLLDITAGFGIRYAIISGYLAAQSILTGKDYDQLIARTFKSGLEFEHKRSEHFRKMTDYKIDRLFKSIIGKFGNELTIDEYESLRGVI